MRSAYGAEDGDAVSICYTDRLPNTKYHLIARNIKNVCYTDRLPTKTLHQSKTLTMFAMRVLKSKNVLLIRRA